MTQRITDIVAALGDLLPTGVVVEGALGTDASLALPAEQDHCSTMIQVRAEEFLTGRTCARRALRRLGVADAVLLPAANRAPDWPQAVRGSISHTRGICLAAVVPAGELSGIGIDVERREAVAAKLEKYIATPGEAARHVGVSDWRTITFSCKESVFKALNPDTGLWLEFRQVELTEIAPASFRALVSPKDHQPFEVSGGYAFTDEYVLSAVTLDAAWALPG